MWASDGKWRLLFSHRWWREKDRYAWLKRRPVISEIVCIASQTMPNECECRKWNLIELISVSVVNSMDLSFILGVRRHHYRRSSTRQKKTKRTILKSLRRRTFIWTLNTNTCREHSSSLLPFFYSFSCTGEYLSSLQQALYLCIKLSLYHAYRFININRTKRFSLLVSLPSPSRSHSVTSQYNAACYFDDVRGMFLMTEMHYSRWNDDQTKRKVQQTMGTIWLEYTEGMFQERNEGEQKKG